MFEVIERTRTNRKSFVERTFPHGFEAKVVEITPAIAAELLANNPMNRHITERKVTEYGIDMIDGNWSLNGEPLIIAKTGELNDGGHRLLACVEAKVPFSTVVVYGVERETRMSLDQGKARSVGHYLAMDGVPMYNQVATMARLALAFKGNNGRRLEIKSEPFTNALTRQYVKDNFDALQEAAQWASKMPRMTETIIAKTLFGFWAFLLRNKGQAAQEYLQELLTGEGINKGDPAFTVRDRIASIGRSSRSAKTEVAMRGWLHYKAGRKISIIKVMGEIPDIDVKI